MKCFNLLFFGAVLIGNLCSCLNEKTSTCKLSLEKKLKDTSQLEMDTLVANTSLYELGLENIILLEEKNNLDADNKNISFLLKKQGTKRNPFFLVQVGANYDDIFIAYRNYLIDSVGNATLVRSDSLLQNLLD